MSKMLEANVQYSIPEGFDGAGEDVVGTFEYPVIESVEDGVETLGDVECQKLLQKAIKIQFANKARVKLMSDNKHTSYREMSEEQKAENRIDRQKKASAIAKLKTLSPEKLAELGITL